MQVFGLIAMFPICVVAEFNHENKRLPFDNCSSVIIKKIPKKNSQSSLNADIKNEEPILFIFNMNLY